MLQLGVNVGVVRADPDHIGAIGDNIRKADRDEVMALGGLSPHQALDYSLKKSHCAFTWLIDDVPVAIFGVGDINVLTCVGAPWLLGTKRIEKHWRVFLRGSRHWCHQLFKSYRLLRNVVDDRNDVSKRWLEWLGFTLFEPRPLGQDGEMFRVFEMRNSRCVTLALPRLLVQPYWGQPG
ncbi:MAG: hypothetical protein JSC189_001033 [Candidatus Tokpelaia sp. JSC189]|nr:MAG: hypothetical protein JSC189_001033 [Candidatus Tokpelaia sp. JSC189]